MERIQSFRSTLRVGFRVLLHTLANCYMFCHWLEYDATEPKGNERKLAGTAKGEGMEYLSKTVDISGLRYVDSLAEEQKSAPGAATHEFRPTSSATVPN